MRDTALTLWGLYGTHFDSGFNGAGGAVYPTIVRFKTSWWAWSTWRNRLCALSCKMWSESTLTDWLTDWLHPKRNQIGVFGSCYSREEEVGEMLLEQNVESMTVMRCTLQVFMMTDGLQFVGTVSYTNLVSQGFSNVRLRPELWDFGVLVW